MKRILANLLKRRIIRAYKLLTWVDPKAALVMMVKMAEGVKEEADHFSLLHAEQEQQENYNRMVKG